MLVFAYVFVYGQPRPFFLQAWGTEVARPTPSPIDPVPLGFDLPPKPSPVVPPKALSDSPDAPATLAHSAIQRRLFSGGPNSLVARAVGHAEGTRTADGQRQPAYYGHVDPGNGAWNLGTFSFQHCPEAAYQCTTPEEADIYQLRRLQRQALALEQAAGKLRLRLTLTERLNGIDLANQAPLAALGTPGYVQLLWQARQQGLMGDAAILWARTQSYWNPQHQRWEAPGLGNTAADIRQDQQRRMAAIAQALDHRT
jgi:hypothetical protein